MLQQLKNKVDVVRLCCLDQVYIFKLLEAQFERKSMEKVNTGKASKNEWTMLCNKNARMTWVVW